MPTPIGVWSFEGDLTDSGPRGNDAIEHGTVSYGSGKIGQCLDLDGTSGTGAELVQHAEADATTHSGSYSVWFKSESTSGNGLARVLSRDLSEYPGFRINQTQTGSQDIDVFFNAPDFTPLTSVTQGEWHHLVMAWESSSNNYYVMLDGSVIQEGSNYSQGTTSTRAIVVGGNTEGNGDISGEEFIGKVDEVRVYDTMISKDFARELSRAKVGHWRLGDMREPVDNFYQEDGVWDANYGGTSSVVTDPTIPSAPQSDQKIVLEKITETGSPSKGDGGEWHGTHFEGYADEIPATTGDVFSFSGWYKLYDESGDPRTSLGAELNDAESSWTEHGKASTTMVADDQWHWFEFTATVDSDPASGKIQPYWKWGYDLGYQKLELCGLNMQFSEHPASTFAPKGQITSGKVWDSSGRGLHGTLSNDEISVSDDSGVGVGAGTFRRNYEDVITVSGVGSPSEFTFAFWANPHDVSTYWRNLIGCLGKGNFILVESSNELSFRDPREDGSESHLRAGNIPTNEWTHIACTIESSGLKKMYIDGQEIASETNSSSSPILVDDLYIGSSSGSNNWLDGNIADVRMYATALDQSAVQRMYENRASILDNGGFTTYGVDELENQFINPSFEGTHTAHIDDPSDIVTSESHTGNKCLEAASSGDTQWMDVWTHANSDLMPEMKSGETWTVGVWAKSTCTMDASFGYAGGGGYLTFSVPAGTDWTYIETIDTISGTNGSFELRESQTLDGSVYFDDVFITKGDTSGLSQGMNLDSQGVAQTQQLREGTVSSGSTHLQQAESELRTNDEFDELR